MLTAIGEGHYWQPNDDQMNQLQNISYVCSFCTLTMQPEFGLTSNQRRHHLLLLTLNDKLFLAPLKDPKRVIDIGTGAGLWAM